MISIFFFKIVITGTKASTSSFSHHTAQFSLYHSKWFYYFILDPNTRCESINNVQSESQNISYYFTRRQSGYISISRNKWKASCSSGLIRPSYRILVAFQKLVLMSGTLIDATEISGQQGKLHNNKRFDIEIKHKMKSNYFVTCHQFLVWISVHC